uniref:ATP-binding region ATPase-like domain-containing protein n=1 Tax=uncultured microorganism TaxID=358574 RepID=F8UHS6_9ZZZZ|nr:ATP-binding region ATPase-like domain-containing protein [uncultured microorganism]
MITKLNLDEIINSTLKLLDETLHPYASGIFILNKVDDKYQLYQSYGLEDKNITFTSESKLVIFLKKSHQPAVIKQIDGISGVNPEISSEMSQLKAALVLPLMLHDDLIGFISLGRKKSDEDYTKDDLDVLQDLARTESIAVANAQLLAEAAQAERRAAIGTMAAGINHEIGNPLNIINTKIQVFLTAVKRGFYHEKPKEEIVQECEAILNETIAQTNRIADITRRLSNFAKPSKEFKPESVNIPKEIEEALFMAGHDVELDRIKIKKEIFAQLPDIMADRREIQQIFFNIIRNGAQAIEGQGIITIRALSAQNGKVHIEIEDTGKGISDDKRHRIFEPFFTTKGAKGTGLGLSIVRQLVWRNKGEISFRSQVGSGTTFILEFPKGV